MLEAEASMHGSYSLDLRERVVALVMEGLTCREVAELDAIAPSTVVKWPGRQRETGSPAAKSMGGRRPFLLEEWREWLFARLAEKPGLTLHALLYELTQQGVVVSCDTLWRFLKREGIGFKKKPYAPASRIALTLPAGADGGGVSNPGLQTPGLHRRNLGRDQYDPHARMVAPR
jgi:transposase